MQGWRSPRRQHWRPHHHHRRRDRQRDDGATDSATGGGDGGHGYVGDDDAEVAAAAAAAAAARSATQEQTRASVTSASAAAAAAAAAAAGSELAYARPWSGDELLSMRWRAARGYTDDAASNVALLACREASASPCSRQQLRVAWQWVHRATVATSAAAAKPPPATARPLYVSSTGGGAVALDGAIAVLAAGGASSYEDRSGLRLYASTARSVVLRCCGWAVAAEPGRFEVHVAALEARGQWELAALSAAFHAQLERAVRSLERGDAAAAADDPPRAAALRTAAMLVAGFAPAAPLWCGAVHSMASRLPAVHLRLLPALLCSATATGAGGGAASAGASLVETSNHRDTAEARPSATATGDVASSDDAPRSSRRPVVARWQSRRLLAAPALDAGCTPR